MSPPLSSSVEASAVSRHPTAAVLGFIAAATSAGTTTCWRVPSSWTWVGVGNACRGNAEDDRKHQQNFAYLWTPLMLKETSSFSTKEYNSCCSLSVVTVSVSWISAGYLARN